MSTSLDITEFRVVREYLREACGLYFSNDKYAQVAAVVGTRMSELGIGGFEDYERLLSSSHGVRKELLTLAALLTTGETYFFRNKDHWRAFEECVLPWVVERAAPAAKPCLRIWSAGCSTGEEAYTVGMVLKKNLPDLKRWSIEILGTDINPVAVAAAERGIYTRNSFRGVPAEVKERYFEPVEGGCYRLCADIRDMVRFRKLNLLDAASVAQVRDVDVVFCRNVLIYFDASGISTVIKHLHRSLRPGGYLFLGHAEYLHAHPLDFASLSVCNTSIYKHVTSSEDAPRPIQVPRAIQAERRPPSTPRRPAEDCAPRRDLRQLAGRPSATTSAGDEVTPVAADNIGAVPLHPPARSSDPVPAQGEESVEVIRARALAQLCAEENAEARRSFEKILKREPTDVQSLLGMGLILAGSGSGEAALQCCNRVLAVHPMSAEAYCVMALVHEGLGQDGLAQRELEKAIYLDDGFSVAHFRLACLHDRMRRPDAVRRGFSNALAALRNDEEQRVRVYSGGFDAQAITRLCQQRLGIEPALATE
ncbi:MAG: hypothetical protein GY842_14890 [bacterium]|nr:hypothetical protein [bacterium]